MITLIIKGDLHTAFTAAKQHGIELTAASTHNKFHEVIASADPTFLTNVIRWFVEPGDAPYPDGALTFYSERKE